MVGPGSPLSANPYEYFASGAVNPNVTFVIVLFFFLSLKKQKKQVDIMFSAVSQDGAMFMDLAFPGSISFVEYIGLITDIWGPENGV